MDAEYIQEQAKAIQEFNKKQREIKAQYGKKKKKKTKKKKPKNTTGGQAVDQDLNEVDASAFGTIKASDIGASISSIENEERKEEDYQINTGIRNNSDIDSAMAHQKNKTRAGEDASMDFSAGKPFGAP